MAISAGSPGPLGGEQPPTATTLSCPGEGTALVGDRQALPLVDPLVLQELEEDLGRPDLATNFAKDYVVMWERRERRLIASVQEEDLTAALDAVISLKVSSTMVGALRLAFLAQTLEARVRSGDISGGIVRELSVHGRATVEELQAQYLQHRG